MQPDFEPGDPAPWPLPSFVRCSAMLDQFTGLPFDCWAPVVTGWPSTDWEAGRQYCVAALAVGRQYDEPTLLINALEAMSRKPRGIVEGAFLMTLAERAMAGGTPPGLTDEMLEPFLYLSSCTKADVDAAEEVADRQLETARQTRTATPVMDIIDAFMAFKLGPCAGVFLHKVCRAAMNGTSN